MRTDLLFAGQDTKFYQCNANSDQSNSRTTSNLYLAKNSVVKIKDHGNCLINVERLKKSRIFSHWPIYDLRSRVHYLDEHILGSKHVFQREILSSPKYHGRGLIYLPKENHIFNKICDQINSGHLGTVRIIDEDKADLLNLGLQFSSPKKEKMLFAYVTAREFVPQLINANWKIYDLSEHSTENQRLLKQYNATYRHVGASRESLITDIESIISVTDEKNIVFLLNNAQMKFIANTENTIGFNSVWYVNTTESSVSSALEGMLTELNYKLAPKPLPKCYRN